MAEEKSCERPPAPVELRRELMEAERSPREIVERLLEHCQSTQATATRAARSISEAPCSGYRPIFQRVLADIPRRAGELSRLVAAADEDLRLLLETEAPEREAVMAAAADRFRSPALVDLLIQESQSLLASQPEAAFDLAQRAHDVSLRLRQPEIGRGWAMTAIARATAHLGNSLRVLGDQPRAERMLEFALELFDRQGTGDLLIEAEILVLTGLLRAAQNRHREAEFFFNMVCGLCRECEALEVIGPVMVEKAAVLAAAGKAAPAIKTAEEALLQIDRRAEPGLFLCAQQNLAFYLLASARPEDAAQVLGDEAAAPALRLDLWYETRRHWLAGRIAYELGRYNEALAAGDAAFQGCAKLGLDPDGSEGQALSDLDFGYQVLKLGQGLEAQPWNEHRLTLAHTAGRAAATLTHALFVPQRHFLETREALAN